MKKILEKANLEIVETHGFRIDFEKYDIIDFSYVEQDDIFYKNKWVPISAEEYLFDSLEKGRGIFIENKVYYNVNLAPQIINKEKKNLEDYINNLIRKKNQDRFGIQKYLINPEDEILVRNAIQFYDMDFDIEFVKKRLSGKVKDVDAFLEYLDNRKTSVAC